MMDLPAKPSAAIAFRTEPRSPTDEEMQAAKAVFHEHAAKTNVTAKINEPLYVSASCEDRLAGGLSGQIFWNWLYIDVLWVLEDFRGCGVGRDMMQLAEESAREKKLTGIYLWTQSWQAAGFYRKLGYEQFVELKNFPPGHSRLGFHKYLA